MKEFIVSVMARDRPGIVAAVSGAIAGLGGNITHLSETVLRGHFTIILSLEAPEDVDCGALGSALEQSAAPGEFQVGVLEYQAPAPQRQEELERFVLTVRCRDRKGIIHRISTTLADAGINIDDFYAYVLEGDLIMILEVGVASGTMLEHVQQEIDQLCDETGIAAHLQHADIFRATTEVQAVLRLGDRR